MPESLNHDESSEYAVSSTSMSELEQVWLKSRGGPASHLRVHQCLARFFGILETDEPVRNTELDSLFKEMGKHLHLSSSEVRQTLREAKEGGVLSVSARLAVATATQLEEKLSYPHLSPISSLRVIVGEVGNRYSPHDEDRANAVAEVAADYFLNVVPERPLASEKPPFLGSNTPQPTSGWIGVSGGNTMLKVVQHIIKVKAGRFEGLTVIPLAGEAEPQKFGISANSVVLRLAEACVPGKAVMYSLMTTPIVAAEDQIDRLRESQETSPSISTVIRAAKQVKFAFTGIGAKTSEEDALERLAYHCNIKRPIPKEVVGDICYRPINENGNDAWPALSRRLVGPTLEDLREMAAAPERRRVFAVACGKEKVQPIIAAVKGGLVNGLITDELTALEILEHL